MVVKNQYRGPTDEHFLFTVGPRVILKKKLVFEQLPAHVRCGLTSVAHGQNDCCSATNDVAACKDAWMVALHFVIDNDRVFASELQSFNGFGHQRVWRNSDGDDDLIAFDRNRLTRGDGTAPAAFVIFGRCISKLDPMFLRIPSVLLNAQILTRHFIQKLDFIFYLKNYIDQI